MDLVATAAACTASGVVDAGPDPDPAPAEAAAPQTLEPAPVERAAPPQHARQRWITPIGDAGMELALASWAAPDGTTFVAGIVHECLGGPGRDPPQCKQHGPHVPAPLWFARIGQAGTIERELRPQWSITTIDAMVAGPPDRLLVLGRAEAGDVLLEIDRDGVELALHPLDLPGPSVATLLADAGQGELLVAGTLAAAVEHNGRTATIVARDEPNVFVARLGADLRPRWWHVLQGDNRRYSSADMPSSLAATSDGGAVVTGECRADRLGPAAPSAVGAVACGTLDRAEVFFAKWSREGALQWLQVATGEITRGSDYGFGALPGLLVALDDGAVGFSLGYTERITLGRGRDRVSFGGEGWMDLVVGRFDADGRLAWARRTGGPAMNGASGLAFDGHSLWTLELGAVGPRGHDTTLRGPVTHTGEGIRLPIDVRLVEYDRDGNARERGRLDNAGDLPIVQGGALHSTTPGLRAWLGYSGELRLDDDDVHTTLRSRGSSLPDDVAVWATPYGD
ncbi:MAG: hypothetical protein U0168_07480 [Nannocystaceae bacterium]